MSFNIMPGIIQQVANSSVDPIEVIGFTAYDNGDTSPGALPSGLLEGDVIFAFGGQDSGDPSSNLKPTGYTTIFSDSAGAPSSAAWYKVMGATPDTTADWANLTGGSLIYVALRNVNITTVQDITRTYTSGATGMPNCPSISPDNDNCLIFASGHLDDDAIESTATPPSGYTLIKAKEAESSGQYTGMVAYLLQEAKSSENPGVFGGGGDDAWVGITIAVRNIAVT